MNDGGAGAKPRHGWIKTNQGVAFCIAVAAVLMLVYLGTSEWAFRTLRDGFRLGFFTAVSVVATLVCALAMMVDRHRQETDPDIARARWVEWAVAVGAMAACYLYFELAWRVDFLLVTPVFMAGATYLLGIRPLRSAVVAGVTITLVIYGLFRLIGIELPSNVLGL